MKRQKEALKKRLGIGTMDVDFFSADDLAAAAPSPQTTQPQPDITADTLLNTAGMSSRERNRLKRKAKQAAKSGNNREKYTHTIISGFKP